MCHILKRSGRHGAENFIDFIKLTVKEFDPFSFMRKTGSKCIQKSMTVITCRYGKTVGQVIMNLYRILNGANLNAKFPENSGMQVQGTTGTVLAKAIKDRCATVEAVTFPTK